jgi:hypothetical protein
MAPALSLALIHRSAWKGNSSKSAPYIAPVQPLWAHLAEIGFLGVFSDLPSASS